MIGFFGQTNYAASRSGIVALTRATSADSFGNLITNEEAMFGEVLPIAQAARNSGAHALEKGQKVLYVTERAVFRLTGKGLELLEVAPGTDLNTRLFPIMDFRPIVPPGGPRSMPAHSFH